ncbi:UNVERIFIED_CONTAM: hypothetical protein HDU68_009102 [Siphonaria sp. JEL0065]|nr:hypothetical protein HDU68_009102 [Siphonaria sp. JEL0065]
MQDIPGEEGSQSVESRFTSNTLIQSLPFEVLINIMLHLSLKDAYKYASAVCRLFYRSLESNEYWVNHCQLAIGSTKPLPLLHGYSSFKTIYFRLLQNLFQAGDLSEPRLWRVDIDDDFDGRDAMMGIGVITGHPLVKAVFLANHRQGRLDQTVLVSHVPTDAFKVVRGVVIEFLVAAQWDHRSYFRYSIQFDKHLPIHFYATDPLTLESKTECTRRRHVIPLPEQLARVDTIHFSWEGRNPNLNSGGTRVTNFSMRFTADIVSDVEGKWIPVESLAYSGLSRFYNF